MSVFVAAEELQTACNCRQQVGVSAGRERGRQQAQPVIRGCQPSPTPGPGNRLLQLPLLCLPTAEPAGACRVWAGGTGPLKASASVEAAQIYQPVLCGAVGAALCVPAPRPLRPLLLLLLL